MEISNNKPIYIQIAENICELILRGEIRPGERIASVRDWAAKIGVNPNTVARSYEQLTNQGVIYNQRGIGYFATEDSKEKILQAEREEFIMNEVPAFWAKAKLLGLEPKEIINLNIDNNENVF